MSQDNHSIHNPQSNSMNTEERDIKRIKLEHHHDHLPIHDHLQHHHHHIQVNDNEPIPHIHAGTHIILERPREIQEQSRPPVADDGVKVEPTVPASEAEKPAPELVPVSEEQVGPSEPEPEPENPIEPEKPTDSENPSEQTEPTKSVDEKKSAEQPVEQSDPKARSKSPQLTDSQTVAQILLPVEPVEIKSQIQSIIAELFPLRRHLGALVYNPTTTWLTLQTSQLTGLKDEHFEKFEELREAYREKSKDEYYKPKYIPVIPPLPVDYINHLLEIKIPYRFVKSFIEDLLPEEIPRRRRLWGGNNGIYTDDSDILTVLAHLGFFNDNLDLTTWNPTWTKQDVVYPLINQDNDIKGDLSVTILLLPALSSYKSVYANGINSRPWDQYNKHNGLSISVFNVKWELEGSFIRDKQFFKRYETEITYDTKYLKQSEWKFDYKYYKQLKEKYEKLEQV